MNVHQSMREFFIGIFNERGEAAIPFLCKSSVSQQVFMSAYKSLPQIETLTPEEKTDMKKYVHNMFPGYPAEFKLQAAKIIYTVGTLI